MDIWQRARSFAEDAARKSQEFTKEAAKKSQELTQEAARRSQEFSIGSSKLSEIVSEASKRSKEIAAEASKRADLLKVEALKRADQIKAQIPAAALSHLVDVSASAASPSASGALTPEYLEKFGVTDELREFVKEITINTFRDFPLEDDSEMSDIPTVSNVRQDLTKWQEIHAKLVLTTVKKLRSTEKPILNGSGKSTQPICTSPQKSPFESYTTTGLRREVSHQTRSRAKEISKLRYELCPRVMKERKFWRIYFILVNSHVAPYEYRYNEELKRISVEELKGNKVQEIPAVGTLSEMLEEGKNQKSKSATSSATEQDLDVFLLGDLGDSDDGPDDAGDDFDDDFDKI